MPAYIFLKNKEIQTYIYNDMLILFCNINPKFIRCKSYKKDFSQLKIVLSVDFDNLDLFPL